MTRALHNFFNLIIYLKIIIYLKRSVWLQVTTITDHRQSRKNTDVIEMLAVSTLPLLLLILV